MSGSELLPHEENVSGLQLFGVAVLWLGVVDPELFVGRTRRHYERDVEHRIIVALVPHKHRFVTFMETLARLVHGLFTSLVIESHGTRGHRSQTDTGVMVLASRASRLKGDLKRCNISVSVLPLYLHITVLGL